MTRRRWSDALVQAALVPRRLAEALSQALPSARPLPRTVLALDGQWLKVLQAEGLGAARRITRVFACPVEGAGSAEIHAAFRDACVTEGAVAGPVLVANPTHLSTARVFSLPSTDPREIRDIVDLQAEKHTPYAKDEILTDFKVIAREASGYSRVLLVIAHQDVVQRPVRLLEAAGWSVERVGCELEGLLHWFQLAGGSAKGLEASLILDIDSGTTTILVVQRGQPSFQRSLAMGAEQLASDPTHAVERLGLELQRSLEALEGEAGSARVQEIVMTGAVGSLGEAKASIERALQLPVRLLIPWEGLRVAPGLEAARGRLPAVSMTGLIGLALGPEPEVDLTPQTTRLRYAFEARARELVLLGCQGLALVILVSLLIIGRAQKAESYHRRLREVQAVMVEETGAVERALRQLEFVKAQLRHRGQLLDIVERLAVHSSPALRWNTLTFNRNEAVVLKGTSATLPQVYEFAAALRTSGAFTEVDMARVAKRAGEEEGVTDFEIRCALAGSGG